MKVGRGTVDGLPFLKILGESPVAGWGPASYTYSVYVEESILIRQKKFARQIEKILADERGWIRGGKVRFQRVDLNANTSLVLATPSTVDKLCYPLDTAGEVSCCQGTKVVINYERWKHGVPHWVGSQETYRQMLVNHEFGHRLGKPHRWCQVPGQPAAVMQQQTYGLQSCVENSWPLDYEL